MTFIIISLVGILIIGLAIRRAIARGRQIQVLSQHGIAAHAKVVRKWRKLVGSGRREWALRYRYSVAGKDFEGQTLEVRNAFMQLEPGDTIEIYYSPENPAISAPARQVVP